MKFRMISASVLALVVGLAVLAPAPALGQTGVLYVATDVGVYVPATDNQLVRVTIGNPNRPDPAGDRQLQSFIIQFDRPVDPVTIGPGESFTYTIDPREVGGVVDQRSLVRTVTVSFSCTAAVPDGGSAPQPALTIEILNRKSGVLESFHAFPGFTGGVVVG